MGSRVFISYSSKDKVVGDAVCAILEQRGIRCWIAPRDILPGSEWGEAIINGLTSCQVFVLVFSDNANQSPQIRREIERAVHHGLLIIPFRIEDVVPAKALEYFMGVPHWLDAMTPPLEQHLEQLAQVVDRLLDDPASGGDYRPVLARNKAESRTALAALGAVVVLPALAGWLALDPPWPSKTGYLSALVVGAGAVWPHFGKASSGEKAASRMRTVAICIAVAAVVYLSLQSLFVETIPESGVRVIKGFVCTPDASLVYGDSCPGLGRDALRDAEWEAPTLWTASSLLVVRLSLVVSWLALVSALGLVANRIERIRISTSGTRRQR